MIPIPSIRGGARKAGMRQSSMWEIKTRAAVTQGDLTCEAQPYISAPGADARLFRKSKRLRDPSVEDSSRTHVQPLTSSKRS